MNFYAGLIKQPLRAIASKSVKRFSDKNCGKNKEREHFAESLSAKNALEVRLQPVWTVAGL